MSNIINQTNPSGTYQQQQQQPSKQIPQNHKKSTTIDYMILTVTLANRGSLTPQQTQFEVLDRYGKQLTLIDIYKSRSRLYRSKQLDKWIPMATLSTDGAQKAIDVLIKTVANKH